MQFNQIVQGLSEGVLVINEKARILFANKAACALFQKTLKKLLGSKFGFPIHGGSVSEIKIFRSRENFLTVEMVISQIEWENEPAYLVSLRDITDRKLVHRLEKEIEARKLAKRQFRTAVEAAPNGMLMVNKNGRILLVNKQIENLFGYRRSELVGRPIHILVPDSVRPDHPRLFASFFDAPKQRDLGANQALKGRRKDGSEFHVEIGLNPVKIEGGLVVIAAVTDISERREAEEMRANFFRGITHDLRTPIAVARGAISNLLDGFLGELTERQAKMTRMVAKSISDLENLVNTFLDLSRIQNNAYPLHIEIFDVRQLLESTVTTFRALAEMSKVQISCIVGDSGSDSVLVQADREAFKRVIGNLISNASRFARSAITISVLKSGSYVSISVINDGPNIPSEDAAQLFKAFTHLRGTKSGTGLGLSICKSLTELMGGQITYESGDGSDARFVVTLPDEKAVAVDRRAPSDRRARDRRSVLGS